MKVFLTILAVFFALQSQKAQAQVVQYTEPRIYYSAEPINRNAVQQNTEYYVREQVPQYRQIRQDNLQEIKQRGVLRCGTNLSVKSYAYYSDDTWHGIDADVCRAMALAILGDAEKINMVNVTQNDVISALDSKRIDVMMGGIQNAAKLEVERKVLSAGLIYYDYQKILAGENSEDLKDYSGQKVCVLKDSSYYENLENYVVSQGLQFNYLAQNSMPMVKDSFLLNRCNLITGSGFYLHDLEKELNSRIKRKVKVLPIKLSMMPVYALVQKNNIELQIALKWVINALFLAEQYGINSKNLSFYSQHNNSEIRNLMGDNPEMWQSLKVEPKWLPQAIKIVGNYGDIYERNLGKYSEYKLKRHESNLLKNGGVVYPLEFM